MVSSSIHGSHESFSFRNESGFSLLLHIVTSLIPVFLLL
jgi:hypothetical protein